MNLSLFYDWVEESLFGDGELAHLAADIIDEASAHDTPGEFDPAERVEEALLASAWRAAEGEEEIVRDRAAVLLGRLGYAGVAQALEHAEQSSDPTVASAASVVLGQLRGIDDDRLKKLLAIVEDPTAPREMRSAAAKAVAGRNSTESTTELVRIARDENPDLAQYGVEGLGCTRPDPRSPEYGDALQALLAALQTDDLPLRNAAAEALGDYGDATAIKPLESVLIEKDPAIRRRALFALAKLGAESAKPPLTRMVRDVSVPARWEIVDLLGRYYGEAMVDVVALAADDRDAEMRDHVVAALALMDGPASSQLLAKIAETDKDGFVREQAAIVLEKRREQDEPSAPAPEPEPEPPQPEAVAPPPPPEPSAPAPPPPPEAGAPPPPPGPGPETPLTEAESRRVLEQALRAMECTWQFGPEGYQVEAPIRNGKEKVAVLLGETDYEDSPVYRFTVNCGRVRPASFEAALRNNRDLDYGSLAIVDVDGVPNFVLVDTMLAGAASVASVRKTITSLAHSAAAVRG